MISEIDGSVLTRLINKYNCDYRTQHFDTKSHLYSLIYANIAKCNSLREIQTNISSNEKLNRMINIPSVSQFSRKNKSRAYYFFEELFYYLVKKAKNRFGEIKLAKEFLPLRIIDATVILTALKLAPTLKMDKDRAGIKISTMFNGEFPEKINIVKGSMNDRKCIDDMFLSKNHIHIFDRGYYNYSWYDDLTENNIKFITRGTKNAKVMEERLLNSYPQNDIYDAEVVLGTSVSKNLTKFPYREITVHPSDEGESVTFITNIFDLETEDIINLYKKRWEIETFFKWIKQNLKIKKFIGYNDNAVRIQIFTSLISYMLLFLICKTNSTFIKDKILKITRIIKVNLLEEYNHELILRQLN